MVVVLAAASSAVHRCISRTCVGQIQCSEMQMKRIWSVFATYQKTHCNHWRRIVIKKVIQTENHAFGLMRNRDSASTTGTGQKYVGLD